LGFALAKDLKILDASCLGCIGFAETFFSIEFFPMLFFAKKFFAAADWCGFVSGFEVVELGVELGVEL